MSGSTSPAELLSGEQITFQSLKWSETSLHDWLCEEPRRLGLGENVEIKAQELGSKGGGSLDILAIDGDTYYSVEVQLGEVDESHGFRVFDYWARNRERFPGKTHVAVLVAESASGRYRLALEGLAEHLPFMVIELRSYRGVDETIVVPEVVITNETLDISTAKKSAGVDQTPEQWEASISPEAWSFHEELISWASENLGPVRADYSPSSYIGVWRGRRNWCPIWPVSDGGSIHLPDPDGSRDEPSLAFEHFRSQLQEQGIEPTWTPSYNAGANPIAVRLTAPDVGEPAVQALLRASYEILEKGAEPWSERDSPVVSSNVDLADAEQEHA